MPDDPEGKKSKRLQAYITEALDEAIDRLRGSRSRASWAAAVVRWAIEAIEQDPELAARFAEVGPVRDRVLQVMVTVDTDRAIDALRGERARDPWAADVFEWAVESLRGDKSAAASFREHAPTRAKKGEARRDQVLRLQVTAEIDGLIERLRGDRTRSSWGAAVIEYALADLSADEDLAARFRGGR